MRYLTAGESHGPQLTTIIEGVPAGLYITKEDIDYELQRRKRPRPRTPDANRKRSGTDHKRCKARAFSWIADRSRRRKQRLETLDENHGIRADHG